MQLDNDTLDACLKEIDKHIVRGELPGGGNGTDPNAQRNGMILAYNLLFQMRHKSSSRLKNVIRNFSSRWLN